MRFVIVGPLGKKNNFGVLKIVKTKSDREQKHNAKIRDEEQFVPLAFGLGCKDLWLENSKMQVFLRTAALPASIWSSGSSPC